MTFSVIFAYVADITEEQERSTAYGLVLARRSPLGLQQSITLVIEYSLDYYGDSLSKWIRSKLQTFFFLMLNSLDRI